MGYVDADAQGLPVNRVFFDELAPVTATEIEMVKVNACVLSRVILSFRPHSSDGAAVKVSGGAAVAMVTAAEVVVTVSDAAAVGKVSDDAVVVKVDDACVVEYDAPSANPLMTRCCCH